MPILSWVIAHGRCRHCGTSVTALYTLIESAAILAAIWAATVTEGEMLWVSCCLGWCLLALAVIDARAGLLPDLLTLPLAGLGLAIAYVEEPASLLAHVIGAALGFASFALIGYLYRKLRRREGLGFGDTKLLAAAGAWMGWDGLPSVVLIGAIFSLGMALVGTWRGDAVALDQRLPFGPGLCLGIWLVWLYGPLGLG